MSAGARVEATNTVGGLLEECEALLDSSDSAGADAREIVAAVMDVPRFWPQTHGESRVVDAVRERALRAVALRAKGAPLQYAVGKAAFRHLTLTVNGSVLIPRPETELLVDLVLSRTPDVGGVAADIGTGSGAIALALATEGHFDRVIATDISEDALELARANAGAYRDRIACALEFRQGSFTDPLLGERVQVLVSNPPYIADSEMRELPSGVRNWEPERALSSGADGLDVTRRLIAASPGVLVAGGLIALEVDARRATRVADILRDDGRYAGVEILPDLTGRPRFAAARRR